MRKRASYSRHTRKMAGAGLHAARPLFGYVITTMAFVAMGTLFAGTAVLVVTWPGFYLQAAWSPAAK